MADTPTGPFYATFAQRIRALVLDWFVFLAVLLAVVTLAATVHFGQRARLGLFTGLIALAVLYEPVLIATRGRTIGHSLCNLRVVAPTATGRLPFWKAFVRWFLKGLTGLASFATMGATERNQALHDLPFGTTVQAADLSKATASQFMSQRAPALAGQRPSRSRRMLVIIGYLVLLFILLNFADSIGASATCLTTGRCEPGERLLASPCASSDGRAGCLERGAGQCQPRPPRGPGRGPPNQRLQLTGAGRSGLRPPLPTGGGQRTVEFGSCGHSARS